MDTDLSARSSGLSQYHLNANQIQDYLPHRYPFLLVDRIVDIEPVGDIHDRSVDNKVGIVVRGQKAFTISEGFFQGHFPGFAIAPGVLLIECMAQVAGFSMYPYVCQDLDRFRELFRCILVGVDSARFRRPVMPGDVFEVQTVVRKARGQLWVFECHGTVEGKRVVDAEIRANMVLDGKGGVA